jgi:Fe2+ or Zn2+ uptake regulation protein
MSNSTSGPGRDVNLSTVYRTLETLADRACHEGEGPRGQRALFELNRMIHKH